MITLSNCSQMQIALFGIEQMSHKRLSFRPTIEYFHSGIKVDR
jgi:hypothetical protein